MSRDRTTKLGDENLEDFPDVELSMYMARREVERMSDLIEFADKNLRTGGGQGLDKVGMKLTLYFKRGKKLTKVEKRRIGEKDI